jgi:ferredoxin-NADP reductase
MMLRVRIESVIQAARTIKLFELRPFDAGSLPAFEAGAHIDVHLPGNIRRSYSLMNDPVERHRYVIGVNRNEPGGGGSRYLHDETKAGGELMIDMPRNNFRLVDRADPVVLVGGGIGITPLWSMIQTLDALGRPWRLFYATRSPEHAILLDQLARYGDRVCVHHDSIAAGAKLDMDGIVGVQPESAHFYCCGPAPMLEAFERATASIAQERVHLERFAAQPAKVPEVPLACTVKLGRSGRSLEVPAEKSILDVLLQNGVDVGYSCMQGVCGACETGVLEGIPAHRDSYLSRSERASNRKIMVCCSRSLSPCLVLDL